MILYKCDFCEKEYKWPPRVTLNGVTGTSGGILLPESQQERHFCATICFWKWVVKYMPITVKDENNE